MKHMVVINKKWLVSVEAENCAQAEYLFLDKCSGITSALAFDEFGTETFRFYLGNCSTVSLKEVEGKIGDYNLLEKEYNKYRTRQAKIDELKELFADWEQGFDELCMLSHEDWTKGNVLEEQLKHFWD